MYQVIGIKRGLTLFGSLCAALFVVWTVWRPPQEAGSITEWWKIASGATGLAALLVTFAGQTPIFPFLCRLPFIREWLPPIDGDWKVEIKSNWPIIQDRLVRHENTQSDFVEAIAKIKARLFYVHIGLESTNDYSTSKTVFVHLSRDPEGGSIQIRYFYRNSTRIPSHSDSAEHDGAASLNLMKDRKNLRLEGVYWNNRNWTKGLNTAGTISMRKSPKVRTSL
jgi:hypothetical protein